MAHFVRSSLPFNSSRIVKIISTETVDNYTVYVIELSVGTYKWSIKHRYSEFHDLHEKLVSKYKIDKGLLPPKKLFGNQSESFIRKRQKELEIYLQNLINCLNGVPDDLASFLHFHIYEIHGITQSLAEILFTKGDLILEAEETFHVSPLQLHAISARLKLAEPTCDSGDAKKDIGHILDFVTRIKHVKVTGQLEQLGTSNILINDLTFDLNMFRNLETLEIACCNPEKICAFDTVKLTVNALKVFQTVNQIKDLLLADEGAGQWLGTAKETVLVPVWTNLKTVDFSYNRLKEIDQSVKLMPKVESLDLSYNQLQRVNHLDKLSSLTHLNVSHNSIHVLESLHTRLGNVKTLNLSDNKLQTLEGLSKLYSLENLDISNNDISQVVDIRHISTLPCLEYLKLTGNSVTIVLDYRTKVLELFKDRAKEVALDGVRATQKELDTVAILLALQKSREAKGHKHRKPRNAKISDLSSDSSGRQSDGAEASTSRPSFQSGALRQSASSPALRSVPPRHTTSSECSTSSDSTARDTVSLDSSVREATSLNTSCPAEPRESSPVRGTQEATSSNNSSNEPPDTRSSRDSREAASSQTSPDNTSSQSALTTARSCHTSRYGYPPRSARTTHSVAALTVSNGDAWLSLLNQSHVTACDALSSHTSGLAVVKRASSSQPTEGPDVLTKPKPKRRVLTDLGHQFNTNQAEVHKEVVGGIILPETLPSRNDSIFMSHLQELLPNTGALSRLSRTRTDRRDRQEERSIHVMWGNVISYTQPFREVMTCTCITTENLHFFEVKTLRSDTGLPQLVHKYCIPLVNLQQIVLGHERQYFRVEEAFVGPQGTFTLISGSMSKTDLFLDSLKLAYRRAISDIDQYEDPHIVSNTQTPTNLRETLNAVEDCEDPDSIHIALYMLVTAMDYSRSRRPYMTHSLVMTSSHVYLLQEDYILWPQATFAIGLPTRTQFTISCVFPIGGKISGIQMYDSDTFSPDKETSLSQTFSATLTCAMVVPNFIGFGVKLVFDMGALGHQTLDIRVPTSGLRDRFLASLTQLRRELSDKRQSPAKSLRSHSRKTREVDADSLSTNSGGSNHGNHGARPKYQKHSAGTKHRPKHIKSRMHFARISGQRPDLLSDVTTEAPVGTHGTGYDQVFNQDYKAMDSNSGYTPDNEAEDKVRTEVDSSDEQADLATLSQREPPTGESDSSNTSTSEADSTSSGQDDNLASAEADSTSSGQENNLASAEADSTSSGRENNLASAEGAVTLLPDISPEDLTNFEASEQAPEKLPEEDVPGPEGETAPGHSAVVSPIPEASQSEPLPETDTSHLTQSDPEVKMFNITQESPAESKLVTMTPSSVVRPRLVEPQLSLDLQYPSVTLLTHLTQCNAEMQLIQPLSDSMSTLAGMEGDELINYFHSCVAQIGQSCEELRHVLWAPVILYTKPDCELVSCIMLSTRAVYFVSDVDTQEPSLHPKEWQTHTRYKSDSYRLLARGQQETAATTATADIHLSSGVIHKHKQSASIQLKVPRTYAVLQLKKLKQVTIGLFDQSFRLVGASADNTFVCMTRDNKMTDKFTKSLTSVLAMVHPTPSPDLPSADIDREHDFYSMFNNYSAKENHEYKKANKVGFYYPSEEIVSELLYVFADAIKDPRRAAIHHFLAYIMVFLVPSADTSHQVAPLSVLSGSLRPRTLMVTEKHLALGEEDHVHYPIPDFAFGPPALPRYRIHEVRCISHLKRVLVHPEDDHLLTLVFNDEPDVVVNVEFDHYTNYGGRVPRHGSTLPEASYKLAVPNVQFKVKLLNILRKQWSELCGDRELVVVEQDSS